MVPNVKQVREFFKGELKAENFTTDRTGAKTIEWIGASFIADEPAIFGTVNEEYVQKELEWYDSMSTNVNDIYGKEREAPQAWQYSSNAHGEINSNYGYLINSNVYGNQYKNTLNELIQNPDGRRASMIYNRPSIWTEYNANGKNDFICTNSVTYYIRNNRLYGAVQMRSNDVIFGYKNDFAWQNHVLHKLVDDLNANQNENFIKAGHLYWQVQNLHVYERHFDLVK